MLHHSTDHSKRGVAPWTRVAILVGSLLVWCFLSLRVTGSLIPADPRKSIVFQGALLLIILGTALLEHKFTKPADSAVNGLMGAITLITVYKVSPSLLWWCVFSYCALVLLLALACTAVSTTDDLTGWRQLVARVTYRPAVFFGRARLLFSVVFLFGLWSFYDYRSPQALALLMFWGVFVVIWPLGLPELLSAIKPFKSPLAAVGQIVRTDSPDVVRVRLSSSSAWNHESPKVCQQADGRQRFIIPLYTQVLEGGVLGTGLCGKQTAEPLSGLADGFVYDSPASVSLSKGDISEQLGGDSRSLLLGFVVEDSTIGEIRIETWNPESCREGLLLWCRVNNERVFYQITEGITREEVLEADRHGFQVAIATQLGRFEKGKGFVKHDWLPAMNTAVFAVSEGSGQDLKLFEDQDFVFGTIPGTSLKVGGPLTEFTEFHTAILGVTGSGKTELAFDVIRECVKQGIKVVCIDLTDQYHNRLSDLTPVDLSLSPALCAELGEKLFDAETGKFGAGEEKKALKQFSERLRAEVQRSIESFLNATGTDKGLAVIKLEEISNTTATLHITELYLTTLLHFAKDHRNNCPRVLIVVEEAHTVMPEPQTMGLGDFASRGLVGKIAQIALQGRKYGVGLLVVAQRTATVSKSVLTQCNTVISFACFDDTSLGFLSNVFGSSFSRLIPNLRPLTAVVYGKGLRSERPLVVQIPFDSAKADRQVGTIPASVTSV